MKILVSISGASGSIYGIRLLEELHTSQIELHLILSDGAKKILEYETKYSKEEIIAKAQYYYENNDLFAAPASGSFSLDAMVIIPCSVKTLSAIANGYCDTLTSRAAICCLKEGKTLILVLRETPLDLATIKNMHSAKENGAIILPANPGFYHKPKTVEEIVNFVVGKTLDQLHISHSLYRRWK